MKVPILLYHGVDTDVPGRLAPYVMSPGLFAEHMQLLADLGRPTTTVSEHVDRLTRGEDPAEGTVLVTFDDGLADFGRHAWPVLRDLDLACTLYVVSGRVGEQAEWLAPLGATPPMLTGDDLLALDAQGCEIGAHSVSHPELDTLARHELGPEVRGARTDLSVRLGHPVRSFAYPHGYHDRRVVDEVRRAGYHSACAVRNMLSSTDDDPFALARITIGATCGVDDLRRVLDGEGLRVAPARERLRTAGWRTYRRTRRHLAAAR
ncbi:polysaccharide deacetylase family protein [Aquihabitans daechungensis]|uniref:polysaccharide deacetylase family protein n=1 Tax=Aquihabitans daechungensis TaxID=1052257 RepID=UPI003B9EC919